VDLFTLAHHRGLHGDAYLIDTSRPVAPLHVAAPAEHVVAALLDRLLMMARSPHAVRDETFAVFWKDDCTIGATEPLAPGARAAVHDTLAAFGDVDEHEIVPASECGLHALFAFERGRLAFFDSGPTRPFRTPAGNRGVRMLVPAYADDPDDDLYVGERTAAEFLDDPEEISPE